MYSSLKAEYALLSHKKLFVQNATIFVTLTLNYT